MDPPMYERQRIARRSIRPHTLHMQGQQVKKRLVQYVDNGRLVHEAWTEGWSAEVHVVNGRDFVYFETKEGSNVIVDIFVPVI